MKIWMCVLIILAAGILSCLFWAADGCFTKGEYTDGYQARVDYERGR